jgi:hypothetical protein
VTRSAPRNPVRLAAVEAIEIVRVERDLDLEELRRDV